MCTGHRRVIALKSLPLAMNIRAQRETHIYTQSPGRPAVISAFDDQPRAVSQVRCCHRVNQLTTEVFESSELSHVPSPRVEY